jgi:release factor glutamine methyltransferase
MKASHLLADGARRLEAAGIPYDAARTEARLLLSHASGLSHIELRLYPTTAMSEKVAAAYEEFITRREQREPLAYITGERDFYGLTFRVTPAVLIPRPETEFVVEETLDHVKGQGVARVADVGTGSGAIAIAVAARALNVTVWATDISAEALEVAGENAGRHGVSARVHLVPGDLLTPVADAAPFDVIASNPPYIAPAEIDTLEPEVRDWEPRVALGTQPDALHFYRRLAAEAQPLLAPGGLLVVEVGQGQADAVAALWNEAGLTEVSVRPDYAGIPRVVSGVRL